MILCNYSNAGFVLVELCLMLFLSLLFIVQLFHFGHSLVQTSIVQKQKIELLLRTSCAIQEYVHYCKTTGSLPTSHRHVDKKISLIFTVFQPSPSLAYFIVDVTGLSGEQKLRLVTGFAL